MAAASPFFASLLPDCELELDVCISTDLSFEEMFCVLEYIYSGKLLCSVKSKDRILSILKDFEICVPDHLHSSGFCARNEKDETEVEIIIEEASERENTSTEEARSQMGPEHTSDVNSTHLQLLLVEEDLITPEPTVNISRQMTFEIEEKPTEKLSNALKMYSNKSKSQITSKTPLLNSETSKPFDRDSNSKDLDIATTQPASKIGKSITTSKSSSNEIVVVNNNGLRWNGLDICEVAEDEWTVQQMPDRETVTLQLPTQFFSGTNNYPKELEHSIIKRPASQCNSSTYPLYLYHSITWCYGIYTPFEPDVGFSLEVGQQFDDPLAANKGQTLVHDWTSFRQPTFLVSRPQRVYSRREVKFRERPNQSKAVLKLTDIQNMKAHNGKIHVTLNGQPLVQHTLPQLFHGGGDYGDGQLVESNYQRTGRRSTTTASILESDDDKIDLALAKHFLQEEVRIKQKLQMRIRMFSERLSQ